MSFSQIQGCILGGAIGDAVGLHTEFLTKQQVSDLKITPSGLTLNGRETRYLCNDRHRSLFEPGGWTDDTDQSLLILMSFLHYSKEQNTPVILDNIDFAKRLKFWVSNGFKPLDRLPLGLGRTVGSSVRAGNYLEDPVGVARERWETSNRNLAANGAVMRSPIIGALMFQDHPSGMNGLQRTFASSTAIAITTHADPRCVASSTIAAGVVASILREELKDETDLRRVVNQAIAYVQENYDPPLSQEQLEELNGMLWIDDLEKLELDERTSIGYTNKCVASGIWALRRAISSMEKDVNPAPRALFRSLIAQVALECGDADTNCAVAGPLLGAYFGFDGLPQDWVDGLTDKEWLLEKCKAVAWTLGIQANELNEFTYQSNEDADNLIDGGKGEFTKEGIDARWKILLENMHTRMGDIEMLNHLRNAEKERDKAKKRKDGDNCIIC